MYRFFRRTAHKAGLAPGSLIHSGEQTMEEVVIRVTRYDKDIVREHQADTLADCFPLSEEHADWISICGLHRPEVFSELGERLGIHPLVLEDVMNTGHRPKVEVFEDHIFIISKSVTFDPAARELRTEQVSMILGPHYLITFSESDSGLFAPVHERLRAGRGKIRKYGVDYLAYALLDTLVDGFFVALELIGERLEELEASLLEQPEESILQELHRLRRGMILFRRSVWPLRDAVNTLRKDSGDLVRDGTDIFLGDLYEHVIQVWEAVETYREVISGMVDLYLSSVSNQMNKVMKVLTIIATIFIPLTFIAGLYGMNFKVMPELEWPYGYPVVMGIMALIAIGMLWFFKRKKWL